MKNTIALALAFACIFALYAETSARASDATSTKAKDVKEPKEIKEAATASKEVKDAVKNAKDGKKMKKDCVKDCGAVLEPVCAHDPANDTAKPKSFGSQCALDNHNCEMGTKLLVKSKGECEGAGGIKLHV